jgi:hypothetical protein
MLVNGEKAATDRDKLLRQIENLPAGVDKSVPAIRKIPQAFLDTLKAASGFAKNTDAQTKVSDVEKEISNPSKPVTKKINHDIIAPPSQTPQNSSKQPRKDDKSRGR